MLTLPACVCEKPNFDHVDAIASNTLTATLVSSARVPGRTCPASGRDNGDITIPREPTQRTTRPQCIPAPLSTGGRRAGGSMRQAQGNPVTDPLDDLHQNDEHQNDGDEHAGFVTVVAVLNGHITDAAGTDRPDHSR